MQIRELEKTSTGDGRRERSYSGSLTSETKKKGSREIYYNAGKKLRLKWETKNQVREGPKVF